MSRVGAEFALSSCRISLKRPYGDRPADRTGDICLRHTGTELLVAPGATILSPQYGFCLASLSRMRRLRWYAARSFLMSAVGRNIPTNFRPSPGVGRLGERFCSSFRSCQWHRP